MNNVNFVEINDKTIKKIKHLVAQKRISSDDTQNIVNMLDSSPNLINHLSLDEISKLSVLGVDLSRYVSAVQMNNIRVFVVKFASDSMMRVSKLIDLLNRVEEKYYNAALSNQYIHPKVASDMIEKIQESITSSVNLMMKLTDNDTLMNLFIVNMNDMNTTINDNRSKGLTSSVELLPPESRKKLDKFVSLLTSALNTDEPISQPVEADWKENEI